MLLDGQSDGVWIGLQDADTLKWTNEKLVTYTNWSPVEPEHSEAVREDVPNLKKKKIVLACVLAWI